MTAAQLAVRLGTKQPSVVALEQTDGKGSVEIATSRRVAAVLDRRLSDALVPKFRPFPTTTPKHRLPRSFGKRIFGAFALSRQARRHSRLWRRAA